MGYFYGDVEGNRGISYRHSQKYFGMRSHIRSWHFGAEVFIFHDEETGKDKIRIYKTPGSKSRVKGRRKTEHVLLLEIESD